MSKCNYFDRWFMCICLFEHEILPFGPQVWSRRCTCNHLIPLKRNQVHVLGPESLPAFAFLKVIQRPAMNRSVIRYSAAVRVDLFCLKDKVFSCKWEHEQSADAREKEYVRYKVCAVLWLRKALVHGKKGQSGFCLGKDQLTGCCIAASKSMCERQRLNVLYVE